MCFERGVVEDSQGFETCSRKRGGCTYVDLNREKQPGVSKYAQIKRTCLCTEKTAYVGRTGACVSLQVLNVRPSSSSFSSSSSCIANCFDSTRDSSSSREYPIPAQSPTCERILDKQQPSLRSCLFKTSQCFPFPPHPQPRTQSMPI